MCDEMGDKLIWVRKEETYLERRQKHFSNTNLNCNVVNDIDRGFHHVLSIFLYSYKSPSPTPTKFSSWKINKKSNLQENYTMYSSENT